MIAASPPKRWAFIRDCEASLAIHRLAQGRVEAGTAEEAAANEKFKLIVH